MESKFNTSFIPKKSLEGDVVNTPIGERYVERRSVQGPGFYLTLLMFITSILASVGIFGYTKIVENSINEKHAKLDELKKSFSMEGVESLLRASTHLSKVHTRTSEHVVVSEMFDLLEKITLRNIQYNDLYYEGYPAQTSTILVSGVAESFEDVALQMEQYKKSPVLHDPVIENLEYDTTEGNVKFSIQVTADAKLTSFKDALEGNRLQNNIAVTPETSPEPIVEEVAPVVPEQ